MANKSVTITEPAAADVSIVQIRRGASGEVTLLAGAVTIETDDGSTQHSGSFVFNPKSLPAGAQTAIDGLVAECLKQFKSQHGF